MEASGEPLVHGLFTPVEEQVAHVRAWAEERQWTAYFDKVMNQFEHLRPAPPWPSERLHAVVLTPHLLTIQETFDALWEITVVQHPGAERSDLVHSDPAHLALLVDVDRPFGLNWEVIDLGARVGSGWNPYAVRAPAFSPHAGILAAAAHHPAWVRAMLREEAPLVWMPGYRLTLDCWHRSFDHTPQFSRLVKNGALDLSFEHSMERMGYAIPEFVHTT